MSRTPEQLKQKAWDALNAKYASLDYPEWLSRSRLPLFFWEDQHNHKRYVTWLGRKLGFEHQEDWYQVTTKDFTSNCGSTFLEYYDNSPYAVVKRHFPDFDWKPWLFRQAPNGFWNDLNNCYAYAKWFEAQRGFKSIEGWYGITQDDVYELSGAGLMDHFSCSVQRFVSAVYPDHVWLPWLFVQVPKNFWPKKKNRIDYMKWLESKLGYTTPEDWYEVSKLDFINNQGASLMQFGYKTVDLIRELYPKRDWQPWMFRQVYQGYWKHKTNRLAYLKWLGKQIGFSNPKDWLNVKGQDFRSRFGTTLISEYYAGSLEKAVKELFPGTRFYPWEFFQVPHGFWDDPANCRKYLNWLGRRLGFKRKEDWYRVRRGDFGNNNGTGFIKRFKTPYMGLKIAFPDYEWFPWRFENVPVGFWENESNRNWYLQWLGKQLDLESPSDWLCISAKQLRANHGHGILAKLSVRKIGEAGAQLNYKAAGSPERI